ncbi:hypothetical protein [Mycolicibacterium thermoresistibile]
MSMPSDDDKSESDVAEDHKVASSRVGKTDDDGTYVGQTSSDDSIDAGETGAEARSTDGD